MSQRFPVLVEPDLDAGQLTEFRLYSPPRIESADASTEGVRFERVLVPVDLSAGSLSVLRHASTLAAPDAMIRVLHAVQLNIAGEARGIPRTSLIGELHDAARQELEKLIETLWAHDTPGAPIIRAERP